MKFPYGISDFYQVISGGYFYVDRTAALPVLEEAGRQLLFLRPRRFGKSLLITLLENYYDVAKDGEFAHLFGQLAIGQNPTPLHNCYLILRWDFSVVRTYGAPERVEQALYDHINASITRFAMRYQAYLPQTISIDPDNALKSFDALLAVVQQASYPLYLLIDEYDNFANEVLMTGGQEGQQSYQKLVQGEGIFKTVFKAVKAASAGLGLERVFITGVSPIVMADISSGYNVAENIYLMPELNTLCGFTEAEIGAVLTQVTQHCQWGAEKTAEALQIMRIFYNGYHFTTSAAEPVYNSTLALYFLKHVQRYCQYPEELLDSNLAMDRARIVYVSQFSGAENLVEQALHENPPLSVSTLAHRFGVAEMLAADNSAEFLLALLYYLGVLTLAGRDELGKLQLRIPNLVIRKLYAERLRDLFLPTGRSQDEGRAAAEALYQRGELQPLCDFVEQRLLRILDNRDYQHANELTIKMAFLALLFVDQFYIVDSETAIQRGYADLTLLLRPEMRQYKLLDIVLEFKYLKLGEVGLRGEAVRALTPGELANLPLVQEQLTAARGQLQRYRQQLSAHYGTLLRLRTFAVVAVGFERLVWSEVI
jgi:Predicted AAA-ATPase/PD-(D/E)XK nuclease superfamily